MHLIIKFQFATISNYYIGFDCAMNQREWKIVSEKDEGKWKRIRGEVSRASKPFNCKQTNKQYIITHSMCVRWIAWHAIAWHGMAIHINVN